MNTQKSKNALKEQPRTRKKGVKVRPVFKIPPPVFQGIKNHFHCVYCKSSYKGTPKIIANHLSGHSHKQNVKVYYTNKFLSLYDRSRLKKQGQFKLANDINRFENTILNNRKLGLQFVNQSGDDNEIGSNMFSKLKFLNTGNNRNHGIPDFILKARAIEKGRQKLAIKNKLNERKKHKNVITNKDRQQLYEAKKLLKQLNKQNSHKKYLIKKSRRKLLKRLQSETDENLNLNYNFSGNRKTKYNHEIEDNSLQVLNHIYKKSPNFNRVFLNASEKDLDIMKIREEYISNFNENLKQRKLRSLKNKIAKVRYRIAIKRKYGKRKYNPKSKPNQTKVSIEREYLDKFNKDFSEENLLKHLKLKLKHLDNVTEKRRMKIKARSNKYKVFNEDINTEAFVKKIQNEDNKYTNSLLLPPRTLNFNNNTLTKQQINFDDLITFPKLSVKSKQKMGPIPSWLSNHSSNKLLNRRLMYPKVSDLNDKIPENLLNHLHKSKRLKQLIKQSLYKEQHIKSMFKYQAVLWKNFKRRNSIYKLNNGLVNNKKVIKLLQAKVLGKKWFNKVYGDREGKKMKLNRLSRYKAIRDKKLKYKKTIKSKVGKKNLMLKNGKKIKVDKSQSKPHIELDTRIKVTKPIKKVVATKKPASEIKTKNVSDSIETRLNSTTSNRVSKPYNRFEGSSTLRKPPQLVSRFEKHKPTQVALNRAVNTTMETAKPLQASRFEPTKTVVSAPASRFEASKSVSPTPPSRLEPTKTVVSVPGSRFENQKYGTNPPRVSPMSNQAHAPRTSRFQGTKSRFETKRFVDKQSPASRFGGNKPSRFQG